MREERLFYKRKQSDFYIWKLTTLLFFFYLPFLIFLKLWIFSPLVSGSILAVIFLQIREFGGIKKNSKYQENQTEKEQYKKQNDNIKIYIPILDKNLEEMNRMDAKLLSPEGKSMARGKMYQCT